MADSIECLFQEYFKLLNSQHFFSEDLDYSLMTKHIEFFNNLDAISNSAISIFDLNKRRHTYFSRKYSQLYGWNTEPEIEEGISYKNNYYHPDDIKGQLEAGIYFLKMALELPIRERKDFKLLMEYRLKNTEDIYVRVIEQQMLLENDRNGNIWLAMGIMDLSPDHDLDGPFQCRAINTRTGDLFHFPPEVLRTSSDLSKREIEILKLIGQGLISKQIADKLYISVNTVNTHRQHIIEKLGVNNTAEALNYSIRFGGW